MVKFGIYTRKGDCGMTVTASGEHISKADLFIETYGTIDELNTCIGYLVSLLNEGNQFITVLQHIQSVLFLIGSGLASAVPGTVMGKEICSLEKEIDKEDCGLPELHDFILPGGTQAAAYAHVCRSVCRRAERRVIALSAERSVPVEAQIYLNRLSDYLFIFSRKLNFIDNMPEKSIDKTCR